MNELDVYRSEFPVLADRTYLISASLGPLSRSARAAAEEHLDLWGRLGPEELWMQHGLPKLQRCRELFARLIGADDDEIAIVPSVSAGLSSIATALDFDARPKVVLSEMDFPTNHYVWRAQEKAGAKLDINVNRCLFESSWIMDLEPIVEAAREHGTCVVVDDFHGSGIIPLDVHAARIDFLLSGALKWLCGGQGIAFLYCRRDLVARMEPRVVGWFGTRDPFDFDRGRLRLRDDARRFESGTYALPQAWTATAGMEIIHEVGVGRIRARNQELSRLIIEGADALGLDVRSPREDERRGGLVRVKIPGGRSEAERVLHGLLERDVVVDSRNDTLRISPHFFNDEGDIERCVSALKDVL
jgi:selenocysteine lyase/cysteine desulfurase